MLFALASVVASNAYALWPANGAPVCIATNAQLAPVIVSDGAGGAIITWYDRRTGSYDIYAQRVDAAGVPQWTPDGVAVSTIAGDDFTPRIASDGGGGAIIAWQDLRTGYDNDIYAQRVNAAGVPQWTARRRRVRHRRRGCISARPGGSHTRGQRCGRSDHHLYGQSDHYHQLRHLCRAGEYRRGVAVDRQRDPSLHRHERPI